MPFFRNVITARTISLHISYTYKNGKLEYKKNTITFPKEKIGTYLTAKSRRIEGYLVFASEYGPRWLVKRKE